MDYSQLSTDDLKALQAGNIAGVSSAGLKYLQHGQIADQIASDPITKGAQNFNAGDSFGSNVLNGIGRGMTSIGRAVGLGDVASSFGLPGTKDEAAQLDAPLMSTTGGKVGNVLGNAAVAAPMAFVPGANTLGGAALLGGAFGGATTEGGLADRAIGAGAGAVGGAAGNLVGRGIAAGASKLADMRTASIAAKVAAQNGKPAAAADAVSAGYALPPTDINPTMLNSALQGLSGKIKTAQAASQQNQGVTNKLAQMEFGLPTDKPLSVPALQAVRKAAGTDYQAVANTGTVTPGAAYDQALDSIVSPHLRAQNSFPATGLDPVVDQINALRTNQFDAGDALAKIGTLRDAADAAYGKSDPGTGKALKAGANALEDALETHLSANGPSNLLQKFQAARQTIAKTYDLQDALNPVTGDVNAAVLAGKLQNGAPLSGNLEKIARAATAFPKATQALKEDYNALSPLDYATAIIGGSANPMAAASIAVRPTVRSAILSGPYQRWTMPSPPSATSKLYDMLQSSPQRAISQTAGTAGANPLYRMLSDEVTMPTMTIRGNQPTN